MIQSNYSPFASLIILAQKKIGDWILCVDYHRLNNCLNTLTIKNTPY